MLGAPMDWWYWFGRWVAGATSVIIVWWLLLDAFRRKGPFARWVWPVIALLGFLLELPSLVVVSASVQSSSLGTVVAGLGLGGLTLVGIAAVGQFSRSSSGSGGTWLTRTRDNDSFMSGSRDRRTGGGAVHAAVSLGSNPRQRRTPTPIDSTPTPAPAASAAAPVAAPAAPAPAPVAPVAAPTQPAAVADADKTVVVDTTEHTSAGIFHAPTELVEEQGPHTESTAVEPTELVEPGAEVTQKSETDTYEPTHDAAALTELVEPEPALQPNPAQVVPAAVAAAAVAAPISTESDVPTVLEDAAPVTVLDDLGARETVLDEPAGTAETVLEEPGYAKGGRLVITDGRSSRLVITERSGPFIVGRDPGRSNLAVNDSKVSRAHFAISMSGPDYIIGDLGSSNGTFLNGHLLSESAALQDGDTIEFGRTTARFVLDD